MALSHSPQIVTNGLVFNYDIANPKSYKGKQGYNYAYTHNPRVDTSYASYTVAGGTWNTKHPDAIRVYNKDGSEITSYVNTGVADYLNTYHAIWTYDAYLNKPVVTMRDADGQWKAKSFGLGYTYNTLGWSAGTQYVISWLQWTTDITKSAQAGLYVQNSGGTWNFHDGQSNAQQTSYNTKTHTWQRVYATFYVSSGLNYDSSLTCYMYGQTGPRGTLKIADVQIERGERSHLFKDVTSLSNAQVSIDTISGNDLTLTNMAYYHPSGMPYFNGISYVSKSTHTGLPTDQDSTVLVWCKPNDTQDTGNGSYTGLFSFGTRGDTTPSTARLLSMTSSSPFYVSSAFWNNDYVPGDANVVVDPHRWNMIGMVARSKATSNNVKLLAYNQVRKNSVTGSSTNATRTLNTGNGLLGIGSTDVPGRNFNGMIGQVLVYNRELSDNEINQIYNALKEKYYGTQTVDSLRYGYTASNLSLTYNADESVNAFKTSGTNNAWNTELYSQEAFTAPCTIEFNKQAALTDNSLSYAMIGWNQDPQNDSSYTSIDSAAYPYRTNGFSVYASGSEVLTPASAVTWDASIKLYISYDTDGYVRYYNGEKLLYSHNLGTGKIVYVDSSFYVIDATYGGFRNIKVTRKSWNGTGYV